MTDFTPDIRVSTESKNATWNKPYNAEERKERQDFASAVFSQYLNSDDSSDIMA